MSIHSSLTGAAAVHQAAYIQAADPGAIGAGKFWVDTSVAGAYVLKLRDTSNAVWETVAAGGAYLTEAQADTLYKAITASTAWASITSTPTTLSGYGITDSMSKATADTLYKAIGYVPSWSEITSKPTVFPPASHIHALGDITGLVDNNGIINTNILPPSTAVVASYTAASQAEMLALSATEGSICVRTDISETFVLQGTDPTVLASWLELQFASAVSSVNGKTGTVSLTASDVGALTGAQANTLYKDINYVPAWTDVTAKPTTFAPSAHQHAWTDVTSTPTTLGGYGITDALSKATGDTLYKALGYVPAWAEITSKPTTVAGYGITDAMSSTKPVLTDYRETVTSPAISGGVLTLNHALGNVFNVNLNANITSITETNLPAAGIAYSYTLRVTQTGAFTITWPASFHFAGGTAPTLSTTAGKRQYFAALTIDGGANADVTATDVY